MGGFGSGGHNRRKYYVEGCRRIDIREMQRAGTLRVQGTVIYTIRWSRNGESTGSMGIYYSSGDRYVTAKYTVTYKDTGRQEDRSDIINLCFVSTGYGKRAYFVCPICGKRIMVLFVIGSDLKCRVCANLNYRSSQANRDYIEVYNSKIEKILQKLKHPDKRDYDVYNVEKPKLMRVYTYKKLVSELENLQAKKNNYFVMTCQKLLQVFN